MHWEIGTSFSSVTSHQAVNCLKAILTPPPRKVEDLNEDLHFALGNKSSKHLTRKILPKFIFRIQKAQRRLVKSSCQQVKGSSAESSSRACTACASSQPPACTRALLVSHQTPEAAAVAPPEGCALSGWGSVLWWGQHDKCPRPRRGLPAQLEDQTGPSSSSVSTWRVQLHYPRHLPCGTDAPWAGVVGALLLPCGPLSRERTTSPVPQGGNRNW